MCYLGPLGLATVIDVSFQHWLYKRRPVGQEFMEHIWTNSGIPPEPLVSWPSKRLGSQVFVLTTSASEKHRADAARMRGDYSGCLSGVTMLVAETPRLANSQIVIGFIANSNQFLGDEDDRTNPSWASVDMTLVGPLGFPPSTVVAPWQSNLAMESDTFMYIRTSNIKMIFPLNILFFPDL